MTTRQAQEPQVVLDYFGAPYARDHAVIVETFHPDRGWVRSPIRKRINPTWARKIRAQGITDVALSTAGRIADFRTKELARR